MSVKPNYRCHDDVCMICKLLAWQASKGHSTAGAGSWGADRAAGRQDRPPAERGVHLQARVAAAEEQALVEEHAANGHDLPGAATDRIHRHLFCMQPDLQVLRWQHKSISARCMGITYYSTMEICLAPSCMNKLSRGTDCPSLNLPAKLLFVSLAEEDEKQDSEVLHQVCCCE